MAKSFPSKGKDYRRNDNLKRAYGITLDDWNKMFEDQGGCCKICGKHQSECKRFHVDHCHETNKVRGLLCSQCNTALGLFYDNTEFLLNAVEYIRSSQS